MPDHLQEPKLGRVLATLVIFSADWGQGIQTSRKQGEEKRVCLKVQVCKYPAEEEANSGQHPPFCTQLCWNVAVLVGSCIFYSCSHAPIKHHSCPLANGKVKFQ